MNTIVKLAARRRLNATEEEVDCLMEALFQCEDGDLRDRDYRGFDVGHCGCGLFVFSDGLDLNWRKTTPKRFLTLLGQIIRNNGLDYLSLGESITGAELHIGSECGGEVRIKTDGSIWDSTAIWKEPSNPGEGDAQ